MLGAFIFLVSVSLVVGNTYYDSYFQYPISNSQFNQYVANGTAANCTILIAPCNATEGRRIDGSCNNLKNPAAGTTRSPVTRDLPAVYHVVNDTDWQPRLAKSGNPLPVCRLVRTQLVAEGKGYDDTLTYLAAHLVLFFATDITATRDSTNYVVWRPHCCKPEGKSDFMCAPNPIPEKDPVHRFSGHRCLNMTKPFSFQSSGCLPFSTTPMRIEDTTPTFDLSTVYGNFDEPARRQNHSGLLAVDVVNGRSYPPNSGVDLLLGFHFFGIFYYWRNHNHIATKLAEVNPCWDNDRLFYTAREINIALGMQHYFYELMPILMGGKNLIEDGVLSSDYSFRDIYTEDVLPQISMEYPVVLRWFHLIQEGNMNFYDNQGHYLNQFPIVNLTQQLPLLRVDGTMEGISQGSFRQPTGNVRDTVADSDMVNIGLGTTQITNDIMTNDCAKSRYFGVQPYIKYLSLCFNNTIKSFDDLSPYIPKPRIEQLKALYEDVADIDLIAGLWSESLKEGTWVTPTLYCVAKRQMIRSIQSDRHWFERPNRPNAFTPEQLNQIRWGSVARLVCDVGDSVTSIQPEAYKLMSKNNKEVSCDEIVDIDYWAWQDPTCPNRPPRPNKSNVRRGKKLPPVY